MRYRYIWAVLLAFALVASACGDDDETTTPTSPPATAGPDAPGPAATQPPEAVDAIADLKAKVEGQTVRIGTSAFPNASITGAFKTADFLREVFGVTVDFTVQDSDPLVAASIAGEVDVGQLSLSGVANAVAAGADFVAFGGDDQVNSFLVAAKAPITSMEELRGEPVAITQSLNQITGQTMQKCLATVGMTVDDVQLVRLGHTGETTQAVASGQVTGGISATFRLTQLTINEGVGAYNILCSGWETNPSISSVWYSTRDWLSANEDMALAINIASLMSARWAQEDKQAWIDYAVENVGADRLSPEAAAIDYDTLIGTLDMWPVNGSLERELMDTTLQTSFDFDAIPERYEVDDLVTFEYQDAALAILGTAERMVFAASAMSQEEAIADLKAKVEGQTVRIGTSAFPNASITGAFKTADFLREVFGVTVDFTVQDSDPLVAASIAGEVDVGQLSLSGVANAVAAGADFVAFGGDDQVNSFLVAAKAPITSMEELRGEPVAITQSLNQITGQTMQKCLATVGMTVDDVQLVRLGHTGETTQAVASGQVTGGISATFRLTQLTINEGVGAYNILCSGWETNPSISSVWYSTRDWLSANEDMALAINIASLMSARWAQEDKQAWIDYAVENVGADRLSPEAAAIDYDTLIGTLDMWPVNGSLERELMDTTLQTSFDFDAIPERYEVDDLVTFKYQNEALAIMGRV